VESVNLVVTALVAGATAGVSGTASSAVADAYEALKNQVLGCFRRGGVREETAEALVAAVADGSDSRFALEQQLIAVTVDDLTLQSAQELLELLRQVRGRKFIVQVRDSTGVVVGDHNQQTIHINRQ
jgi:hypothetical protein